MKKRLTVTVGTAAYNEEANIAHMLKSVLMQKEIGFVIRQIIVNTDGCTDETVKIARSFTDKRIRVLAHTSRKGQATRLAEVFRMFTSDYLVIMDADTVLGNKDAIANILKPFSKSKRLGVVAGNTIPIPGKTFLERSINNYIYARQALQKEYDFGKKALVAHAYLAFTKAFAKAVVVPTQVLNLDAYSYFAAVKLGFGFGYAKDSLSYYRSASRIKEYVKQTTRHMAGGRQLQGIFGAAIVREAFSIPPMIMRKILMYQLKKSFFGYVLVKVLFTYADIRSRNLAKRLDSRWEYVSSTKGMISL